MIAQDHAPEGTDTADTAMAETVDGVAEADAGGEKDTPDGSAAPNTDNADTASAWRVLARKYRPRDFSELVGQEALVRTLSNAIDAGRIAQAFVLTGVRGVGKTTTARIIAKALNCIGPDGTGAATAAPCGQCEPCRAIADDRHIDVTEMDAASLTGVDTIRDLIDGARYRPVSARYKVYILDEVHMLSKNAFNALLKTLEEPPEHVKFIFATTEIRKVPVTVLSRCQRFDLRRVPVDLLYGHFSRLLEAENIEAEAEALTLIARAADGSVRDGLSMLDQAAALGGGQVRTVEARDMLGLADRARIYDLFEALMGGDAATALDILGDLYENGADPAVVISDLLDVTYWLTRGLLTSDIFTRPATAEMERVRGRELTGALDVPTLSRAWQMLMKGLDEVRRANVPIQAAEMVLIRLVHSADLPPPGTLVKRLMGDSGSDAQEATGAPPPSQQSTMPTPLPEASSKTTAPAITANKTATSESPMPKAPAPETAAPDIIADETATAPSEDVLPDGASERARLEAAAQDPLVRAVRATFPDARITGVTSTPAEA